MWIKLVRNRFWIAVFVLITTGMILRDKWKRPISHPAPLWRLPEAASRLRSLEPIYPVGETAILPDGSRVSLAHYDSFPDAIYESTNSLEALGIKHEITGEMPIASRLMPDTGDWEEGHGSMPRGDGITGEYAFHRRIGVRPAFSYAAAWLSESVTVARFHFFPGIKSAAGVTGRVTLDTSERNTQVVLTLSEEARHALFGQNRAHALILVDRLGNVHRSVSDSLDVMDKPTYHREQPELKAEFEEVGLGGVAEVRLVTAPLHWVRFHRPPSAAEKKLAAEGIYVVPKLFREPLRRRCVDNLRRDAGIESGAMIVEATKFLPVETARGVPDAVVVAGRHGENPNHSQGGAVFTVFLPGYMAGNISLAVCDANGTIKSDYSDGTLEKLPNQGETIAMTYSFPGFQQKDVKRLVITAR
jgi:hypothetical protein